MIFELEQEGDFSIININESRLDASLAEQFKTYLFEQIEQGANKIIINLANIKFMDSSGLGALVAALKKISDTGDIHLAAAQPAVLDLFELTSMEKLFSIHSNIAQAKGE